MTIEMPCHVAVVLPNWATRLEETSFLEDSHPKSRLAPCGSLSTLMMLTRSPRLHRHWHTGDCACPDWSLLASNSQGLRIIDEDRLSATMAGSAICLYTRYAQDDASWHRALSTLDVV